jgi:ABC-type uncharacterized transport system ATPase subunit
VSSRDRSRYDSLKSQGVTEVIYSHHEINELRKLSKEDLKTINKVKEIFPGSNIEEIKRNAEMWKR